MESKIKKRSVNTVIYLLLATLLATMVFVSIYTVSSKRREKNSDVDDKISTADTDKKTPQSSKVDTTSKHDFESSPVVTEPSESASVDMSYSEDTEVIRANEQDEVPMSAAEHYFVLPVDGFISKDFEIDVPVWSATMCDYRAHTGVDIVSTVGSEVIASSSGIVCDVFDDPMMGKSVTVDHGDGIYTTYNNLGNDVTVSVGDKVGMGQLIGCVGNSSLVELAEEPHLHLEMKINGNYVNPLEYMSSGEYSYIEE